MKRESAVPVSSRRTMIPRLAKTHLHRPALVGRLDVLEPLTVVRAMGGTGKTSLVARWARMRTEAGDRVVWIGNDADECPVETELVGTVLGVIESVRGTGRVAILVVDDVPLDGQDAESLMDLLWEHEELHIVSLSTAESSVERVASERGLATAKISGRDLAARREETDAVFAAWGHAVDAPVADHLWRATGGWLAAMRRALDANPDRGVAGMERSIDEYVGRRVERLLRENGVLREGILFAHSEGRLARIEADTVPLDAVTRVLNEAGLIIGGVRSSPCLPTVVERALLSIDGVVTDADVIDVHQAVVRTLVTQGERERGDIVRHAGQGQMWPLLESLWAEAGIDLLVHHLADASKAYGMIPLAVRQRRRDLADARTLSSALLESAAGSVVGYHDAGWGTIASVASDVLTPASETALLITQRSRGGMRLTERRADASTTYSADTRAWMEMHKAISAWSADSSSASQQFAHAILDANAGEAKAIASLSSAHLSLMRAVEGSVGDAVALMGEAERDHDEASWVRDIRRTILMLARAVVRLDRLEGDVSVGLEHLAARSQRLEEWMIVEWLLARHSLLFGDPAQALRRLETISSRRSREIESSPRDRHLFDRTYVDLLIAVGAHTRASVFLERRPAARFTVPRARIALASGELASARQLASARASWNAVISPRERVEALLIAASAALEAGDEAEAASDATRAFEGDDAGDRLAILAGMPTDLREGLLRVAGLRITDAQLTTLRGVHEIFPTRAEVVRLTRRETVVLHALAERPRLADVASELSVSVNTIKKQVTAIYAKLEVHDRASALHRATRLGLLGGSPERGRSPE